MTESEAIEKLKNMRLFMQIIDKNSKYKFAEDDYKTNDMAIKALEEVQQYRAIGTPEECRTAREKQIPKKPTPIDYEKYIDVIDNAKFLRGAFWCSGCKHVVHSGSFCGDCGQKLDWSDEE